jgi:hypothetical protein
MNVNCDVRQHWCVLSYQKFKVLPEVTTISHIPKDDVPERAIFVAEHKVRDNSMVIRLCFHINSLFALRFLLSVIDFHVRSGMHRSGLV